MPFEIKSVLKHRLALFKVNQYSGSLLKLNVGCGNDTKAGYVNIDSCNKKCLQLDMRENFY
jgi:hypothetical protein